MGLILWCGGLGFGALNATGSLQLTPGVPAQVVTQDGSEHLVLLDHHHTLIEVDEDARSGSRGPIWRRRGQAEIRVEHPTTRAQAVYHLSPRESIGFQDYRISALSVRPEEVTLRFAERWVWWWRVLVLGLTVVGYLLLIAVPYRAWLWLGRSGDYQLRAWSFNAGRSTPSAVNRRLEGALGPEESAELSAIERAMKISTQPGGAERLQMADPALVLRLFVVPLAALLGLAHELVAAAPGTGVSPLALGVAAAVLLLNDVRWI